MASTGHSGSHSVQSMHSSGSITRKFGPSWKQSTGQTSTQSIYLHLMQLSVTTNAMTYPSLDLLNVNTILPHSRNAGARKRLGGSGLQAAAQLDEMVILASCGAILEVLAQREHAALKRQMVPRDLGLCVQTDLQALRSRREFGLQQSGPEHHVHLVGTGHAGHRQQRADLDPRHRLFVALARRRGLQGLAVFHESGRYRPKPQARFDRTAAQQDLALPLGQAAQNQQRVLVVNHAAICADEAR